jgi:UDP-N-acetylmuramoyl-L-alanyl-D-glutamate--2,6-diaminopimelate ligase
MVASSCTAVAMEVSSHGLDQGRVDHIDFDAAIFTNLTQDHLDYHKTMERYAEAKAKLFTSLNAKSKKKRFAYPRTAIINNDSPYSEKMIAGCTARVISYGIQQQADVRAEDIVLGKDYSAFNVVYEGKSVPFRWNLIGRFNISNCLAVTALGLTLGVSLEEIAAIVATFQSTRGRLEQVPNEAGLHIYVDYAHTDDALINVLTSLNEVKEGRIITVFGCGGNRDRGKRPKMAQAAGKLSDVSIVTSDNPRDEDPLEICQEVIQGFAPDVIYQVEVDRRKAIELAVQSASHEDIILIAGKGHETYQVFKHKTIQFDDKAVAAELCAQRAALQKGK